MLKHRAADIGGRNGLSFLEVLLWVAALEPHTKHAGAIAELRCRYIFRYLPIQKFVAGQ